MIKSGNAVGRGTEVSKDLPLTPTQQGMLFHRLRAPGSGVDIEQIVCRMREALDPSCLSKAFDIVVARYDALRASFVWQGREQPAQQIRAQARVPHQHQDWSQSTPEAQGSRLKELLRSDRRTDFDMRSAPLMRLMTVRLGEHESLFLWTFHHILLDGRSFALVLGDLFDAYDALLSGATPLASCQRSFTDFLADYDATPSPTSQAYFRELLQGISGPTPLEVGFVAREPVNLDQRSVQLRLSTSATAELVSAAQSCGVTPNTMFQAAWALLLRHYSRHDDVVFGSTRACRDPKLDKVSELVGLLINTVPMRVSIGAEQTILDFLQTLRAQQVALRPHERVSLGELQQSLQLPAGMSLFDSIAVFDHATIDHTMKQRGPRFEELSFEYLGQTNFPLTLAGYLDPQMLVRLEFDPARFDIGTAQRMLGHFRLLLERLSQVARSEPGQRVRELGVLSSAERAQLIEGWNATDCPYPDQQRMHDAFEQRARATPHAVAAVCLGAALSYGELEARANKLAHLLRARGVRRGQMVGLCLPRSFELIVSMLAVLKAGGAYVPLDPAYPLDRLAFMLSDTRAKLVLTLSALSGQLPSDCCELVCLDAVEPELEAAPASAPSCDASPRDVAYIIYTSGSTGLPKGVVVRHQPALNLIAWVNQTFAVGPSDRLLFVTSVCFDLSVYDVFGMLSAGGSIHIATSEELRDPRGLVRLLSSGEITFWDSAPATLAQLTPFLPERELHSRLRLIFMSGDWIPVPLPERLRAAYPAAEVVSLGGATEATIWSNFYRIGRVDPRWPSIPYGRPIQNARYYVLDEQLEPLPIGVPGHLHIGGYCLAEGYHNRADLNAEKFIDSPFLPGTKLYRTGDLARFMPDGNIEFLGRLDFQVKVRGYRIELGEIEAVLSLHPGVSTSLVDAPRTNGADRVLVAYIVPRGAAPELGELKSLCHKQLPEYMVPAHFVVLEQLPVTANGKVDRRALPAPSSQASSDYVAPRDELETTIASVFSQCLGLSRVGIHDNFFELGGQSLVAVRVIGELENRLSLELSVGTLFEKPTVAQLSAAVREGRATAQATLVPLHRGSNERPLFFICGIHLYQELAHAIGGEQSSYGIFLPAEQQLFSHNDNAQTAVEELASMYIAAIRQRFPEGPYLLAGVSFGGVLAYEMSRQLEASGQQVSLLVLIDSILPSSVRVNPRKWLTQKIDDVQRSGLRKVIERTAARMRARLAPPPAVNAELGLADLRQFSYRQAAVRYEQTHNTYGGRTLLIRAENLSFIGCDVDPMLGWSNRLSGDVMVSQSQGDHLGVLREQLTADVMRRALEWVRERAPAS
ncbi:MAG: non-ribosomal peptide synthetase [Myxococcaceae bacterium]|nr:non-ribosomal peptide synthetase [Myxococcaceae bacterium]